MEFTAKEKEFIKAHSDTLEGIFKRSIEEMKDSIFSMGDKEKREMEIRFVIEYKAWLEVIGIFKVKKIKKPKKRSFI